MGDAELVAVAARLGEMAVARVGEDAGAVPDGGLGRDNVNAEAGGSLLQAGQVRQ